MRSATALERLALIRSARQAGFTLAEIRRLLFGFDDHARPAERWRALAINRYLAGLGDKAPVRTLEEIIKSRRFHPSVQVRLESGQASDDVPGETAGCRSREECREKLRAGVVKLMEEQRLDALVYPTWSNPPRLVGDLNTRAGDNNQVFSPSTGFPAVTVPMGDTRGTLPAGLQFFGRPWSEAALIRLAYAYEHATHHRHPPASTPPLR